MKLYLSTIGHPEREETLNINMHWRNPVNLLVLLHAGFFLLCTIAKLVGFTDSLRYALSLPGDDVRVQMVAGLFTHPFVHFSAVEFLISMGALWLFGHILQSALPALKVMTLYWILTLLSAAAFLLSHFVFEIFSGRGALLEGAFPGVLGIVTVTMVLFRSHQLRFRNKFIPLWHIYVVVLIASFTTLLKPSFAYAMAYGASIWMGGQYGLGRLMAEDRA